MSQQYRGGASKRRSQVKQAWWVQLCCRQCYESLSANSHFNKLIGHTSLLFLTESNPKHKGSFHKKLYQAKFASCWTFFGILDWSRDQWRLCFLVLCFCCCSQTFMPFEWSTGSTVFALNYTHSSKQFRFSASSVFVMVEIHVLYLFQYISAHHLYRLWFLNFFKLMELKSPAHFEVCSVLECPCNLSFNNHELPHCWVASVIC